MPSVFPPAVLPTTRVDSSGNALSSVLQDGSNKQQSNDDRTQQLLQLILLQLIEMNEVLKGVK